MSTGTMRLVTGGSLAALTVALALAGPANAADEGRNSGADTQAADTRAAAAPATGTLFAVVNQNAGLVRGDAVSVARGKFVGDYIVRFPDNVTACAYSATIGQPGRSGVTAPGFITVAGSNTSTNSVYVSTYNLNAVSAKRSFHLIVACPE